MGKEFGGGGVSGELNSCSVLTYYTWPIDHVYQCQVKMGTTGPHFHMK